MADGRANPTQNNTFRVQTNPLRQQTLLPNLTQQPNGDSLFPDSQRDKLLGGNLLQTRLQRNFFAAPDLLLNSGNVAVTVDPEKVQRAVDGIKKSLSEGVFDWDVSHGDLNSIRDTFRDLNTAEASQVAAQLSDDDLRKWAGETIGLNGGYDRTERQELFGELANKLDGGNLARLAVAFGDERGIVGELAQAVANSNSPQAKLDFVKALAPHAEKSETAANAVAVGIGGLRGDAARVNEAVNSLSDKQMEAVMKSTVEVRSNPSYFGGGGSITINYDGNSVKNMLTAVATSDNPEVKSRVFNAAGLQLKSIDDAPNLQLSTAIIGKNDAGRALQDGLTDILRSDTNGVINVMTYAPEVRNGEALTAYSESMIRNGQTDQLGEFVAKLARGENLQGGQIQVFRAGTKDNDGNNIYPNAAKLGYFYGAMLAGNSNVTGDLNKQADVVKKIITTAAGMGGLSDFPALVFEQQLDQASQTVVEGIAKGRNESVGNLLQATYPQAAVTDELYRSEAYSQYEQRADHVILSNK